MLIVQQNLAAALADLNFKTHLLSKPIVNEFSLGQWHIITNITFCSRSANTGFILIRVLDRCYPAAYIFFFLIHWYAEVNENISAKCCPIISSKWVLALLLVYWIYEQNEQINDKK